MSITKIEPNLINANANFTFNAVTATGNLESLNANLGNAATANYFIGNGSLLTGIVVSAGNSIVSGNSNVSIPSANGNVNISAVGNANVLVITGTGANIAGTLNVTGNANAGNIGASAGVFTGNVSANNLTTTNKVTAGNGLQVTTGTLSVLAGNLDVTGNLNVTGNVNYSNVTDLVVGDPLIYIGANNTGDTYDLGIVGSYNNGTYYHTGLARNASNDTWTFFDGVVAEPTTVIDWANATYPTVKLGNLTTTGYANITGNITAGNANLGNAATANYFIGSGANLTSLPAGNISGQVANALVAGTVYTNAQPNITSVGSLTGLTVSNSSGVVNFTTTANVTLGAVANLHISGGTNAYVLSTDGAGNLSWVAQSGGGSVSNISNGNSNVNIPSANGNVNISAVGNANVLVITGTGANITGTANISGNLSAGNISAGSGSGGSITGGNLVSANYFTGTLTTAAQPNITSLGTLTSVSVTGNGTFGNILGPLANGNSNVNIPASNGNINLTAVGNTTMVITGTGANIAGYANVTGNVALSGANVSLGAVGNLHITGGSANYILQTDGAGNLSWATAASGSNISNGNSNVNIPSANGNVNISSAGNANIVVVTGTGLEVTGTANVSGNLSAGNISAGSGSGGSITGGNLVSANYFTGTLTTAAQPNITSVGSLTGLTVSNATGVVNFTTTANVTLGAVGNLHITGGTNAYVLSTDGAGNLSWVAQSGGGGGGSNIANGNSNVSIATANGNITMSAVGNANIVVVTGTGVNVAGTLNTTGNVALSGANVSLGAVGNVKITGGSNTYVLSTDGAGNLSWTAPPASANVTVDSFTGNGVQTVFTLSTTPIGINQTSINYNGATVLRSDYTLANANITFSSAPADGSLIEVTTINLTSGGGGTAAAVGYSLIFGG